MSQQWNESLFGCFSDCSSCCIGYFCVCCLYGQNQNRLDGSDCCTNCCIYYILMQCLLCACVHAPRRKQLREKYDLTEECNDWAVACFCGPCALCQETREMQRRGPPPNMTMGTAVYANSGYAQSVPYGSPAYPVQYAPPQGYAPANQGYPPANQGYQASQDYAQPQYGQSNYQQQPQYAASPDYNYPTANSFYRQNEGQ